MTMPTENSLPSIDLPRIALIGDHDPAITAHRGIAASLTGRARFDWLVTDTLPDEITALRRHLAAYDGIWCIPGSPYRRMAAALAAIRVAREDAVPFLGTCGGFQHAVIEFMRNALGLVEADHAESNAATAMPVIAPLTCSLVGATGRVRFKPGSRLARAIGWSESIEGYHCSYGLNRQFQGLLDNTALRATGFDDEDEIRGIELDGHPFFIATLFQPERAALPIDAATGGKDAIHPLVLAFIRAAQAERSSAPVTRETGAGSLADSLIG
jgi:CTP synthase (UTP-ammonia lyase)